MLGEAKYKKNIYVRKYAICLKTYHWFGVVFVGLQSVDSAKFAIDQRDSGFNDDWCMPLAFGDYKKETIVISWLFSCLKEATENIRLLICKQMAMEFAKGDTCFLDALHPVKHTPLHETNSQKAS